MGCWECRVSSILMQSSLFEAVWVAGFSDDAQSSESTIESGMRQAEWRRREDAEGKQQSRGRNQCRATWWTKRNERSGVDGMRCV
jgi:hypothetical protein